MSVVQLITAMEDIAYSASEAIIVEAAKAFARRGHTVDLLAGRLAMSHASSAELRSLGVTVRPRGRMHTAGRAGAIVNKVWQRTLGPRALQSRVRPDARMVVVNFGSLSEAATEPWASFLAGCERPFALILHNNPEIREYRGAFAQRLRRVVERAIRVYCVSQRLLDNLREQLLIPVATGRVIRNPVNLAHTGIEPWPSVQSPLRMALVGRLRTDQKGHVRLLHALAASPWRDRDWAVSLFGTGPDRDMIAQAIHFYGLQDRVVLRGHVSDIRREIWADHHVLVMPSLYEGMPLTLVEAMLCGRVALCSDVGGAAELVVDSVNGFLAGSPFARQFGIGLERLWEARDRLEEIGRRAHEAARTFVPDDPGDALAADLLDAMGAG